MTTERPAITLVQPVPDAAWFERQVAEWQADAAWEVSFGSHLRGNLSPNADAVLVDGPTLKDILDQVFLNTGSDSHSRDCGMRASLSNPCTCWRAKAKAMRDSLKGVQP